MKQNMISTVSGHAFVSLKAIAVSVAVACTATTAAANDEKLYGAPLPDNAAFVRVLGAQPDATPEAFGVPLTSDGNYTVVQADTTDGIEVNPAVVPVAIFTGDVMLGDSIELQLRRGENPSSFVAPDGSVSTILSNIIWDE